MRAAFKYPWDEISTIIEIEEITTECVKYEDESIPLLILIEKDGYATGFRLHTHEIGGVEGLITEALIKGCIDLRDRKQIYCCDDYYGSDNKWEMLIADNEDDDSVVRIGKFYPE